MEPTEMELGMNANPPKSGSVAKQGIEEAKRIGVTVRQRIYEATDSGKSSLVDRADTFLGGFSAGVIPEAAMDRAKDVVEALRTRSTEDLVYDAQQAARRRPGLFMLGALAVGFLAGRVLVDVGSES